MTKRYAICKILGDGQPPDGYYPAIFDVTIPVIGIKAFRTTPVIGLDASQTPAVPVASWCLVVAELVDGAKWSLLDDNDDVDLLPEYPLDAAVSAMHLPTRNGMAAAMQARGIDTSFIGAADGFRDVINHLGRIHEPAFDADSFAA